MFFFKEKTAYEMRISYWSSDVCSSDLVREAVLAEDLQDDVASALLLKDPAVGRTAEEPEPGTQCRAVGRETVGDAAIVEPADQPVEMALAILGKLQRNRHVLAEHRLQRNVAITADQVEFRSEEHTSELQSLMRSTYAVFCWKKKKKTTQQ